MEELIHCFHLRYNIFFQSLSTHCWFGCGGRNFSLPTSAFGSVGLECEFFGSTSHQVFLLSFQLVLLALVPLYVALEKLVALAFSYFRRVESLSQNSRCDGNVGRKGACLCYFFLFPFFLHLDDSLLDILLLKVEIVEDVPPLPWGLFHLGSCLLVNILLQNRNT